MLIRLRRTALYKSPRALADGLMLVFKHAAYWHLSGCQAGMLDFQRPALIFQESRPSELDKNCPAWPPQVEGRSGQERWIRKESSS
jgi:hypothetical protein